MKETSDWFVLYRLSVISHVLSGGSPAQILNCLGAHSVRVSSEQSDLKIRLLSALYKSRDCGHYMLVDKTIFKIEKLRNEG